MKMECLVDDKMNSNLLSSCPNCGIGSSSSFRSSSELFGQCEKCMVAASIVAVNNNNPTAQIGQDIMPLPGLTRPRCCSCLEKPSSSSTPSEFPSTAPSLDATQSRPRSQSSPDEHSCAGRPSSLGLNLQDSVNSGNSGLLRETSTAGSATDTRENTGSLCSSTSHLPQQQPNSHERLGLSSDKTVSEAGEAPTCPKCGGVSSSAGTYLDAASVRSNINIQHVHGGAASLCSSAKMNSAAVSPATAVLSQSVSEGDQSPKVSPWSRKPRGSLSPTGAAGQQKVSSSLKQLLDVPANADDASAHVPQLTKAELASTSAGQISPQNIIHNMERNRITTARSTRTPQTRKSSRAIRQEMRLGVAPPGPSRHSMHSTRDLPRIVTPDSPLPCLPSELLYELHELGHENEDLSAEVVYSLHFRDYQIKELLGKGISSTVRRVTEKSTGSEYAVKIIDISGEKGELSQVDQIKKDTFREIQILRMCAGHSNIIELHDVFETPTFIFLVFELCRKGELFDYLTSVVSLSEKRTRIFMRQLFEAVAYIHDKNIVHRDLKPENILLDDGLNIKVSDFGFAAVVGPGEDLTELCGTPGYLAPEVLAHSMYENVSGYGKEVDMWACGVIMYTLLCGAPPFWNRRQMLMLRAIMNADYTFNSPEWDDITEAPKNLIRKLLLVNPKERLTAKEALQHPFFHSQVAEEKKFQARRKFKAGVTCIIFYMRLNFFYKHPPPISMDMVCSNPYGIKLMRKVIDTCAFSMYKHWVKRVDNQNRAALFEHTLRDDWKHTPMAVDGVRL